MIFHPIQYNRILPFNNRRNTRRSYFFCKSPIDIDDHKIRTIKHWRKSLLFHNNVAWKKKTTTSCIDVTMGSYDGAEVCELVHTFILSKLGHIIDKKNTGLYGDDRLVVLSNMNAWGME